MMKNSKRKDGRLQSKVYLGDGKYKYVYAATNKELAKKVQELKLQLGKGIDLTCERDTFDDWAQRWLRQKKTTLSTGRYNVCTYRLNNLEKLKYMQISKIRTSDIQDIIYDMHENGSSRYVMNEVKNTAKQVLQLAINNRVMDFNPAIAVEIPKTEEKEGRRALTPEEQSWIAAPTEHRAHRMAMIMMYAGLRRGEVIPLLWSDVDLEARTISVNKAVEMIDGKSVVKDTTKTTAGKRIVYIPRVLADFLASEPRDNNMLVCPDAKGRMMSESAYKRLWESYLAELNFKYGDFSNTLVQNEKTGKTEKYVKPTSRFAPKKIPFVIPRITAHMLRHTFITLMYMAGVDLLTAKEQAGHADIQTTMDIYTHLDNIHKTKQINKLDEFLSGDKKEGEKTG